MDGVIDLISNKVEADKFVVKIQSCNFPVFAPPGAKPTRAIVRNNTAATKTQLKAEKKAVKEKKTQADEEKKLAVAAGKLEAQAKKRKKAIALAEARAQKAAAKAEALQIQLASVKAADEATRTLTRDRGAHVPKKSKGTRGEVALLTSTNLTSIIVSPQLKGSSPKKRVMVHLPHRLTINKVASSDEAFSSESPTFAGGSSLSSRSESSSSSWSASSGRGGRAVFIGGRCHATSGRGRGGSGLHPPGPRDADLLDESMSSAVGSDGIDLSSSHSTSKRASGENYRSPWQSSLSSSESLGIPSPVDTSLSVACKSQAVASFEDSLLDEGSWGERALPCKSDFGPPDRISSVDLPDEATPASLWPGQTSTPLLSCFVALYF
jgi:hypothetical protein